MEKIDCAVIGAGVVGLAIARELALAGHDVVILEAEPAIGMHTSSRNSEVIHAGLSYPAGSLKSRLCVTGKHMLYRYCEERGVGHQRIGKLIVATQEADVPGLQHYLSNAAGSGVTDLRLMNQAELKAMEPEVAGLAAVFSPSTGIVDSHGLMLALLGDAQNAGAVLVLKSAVLGGEVQADGIVLRVGGAEPMSIHCKHVINAAGLQAHHVASSIELVAKPSVPPVYYAAGRYYTLAHAAPFKHLVYPVSREATLRVHVTLDLAGQCKFGPDLQWTDTVDYEFKNDEEVCAAFYAGIRRYYPNLADGALVPGYTGIRPRLAGPDSPLHSGAADFVIQDASVHGVPGLIHLFGIESPGLTSSLAIAQYVGERLAATRVA